MKNRAQKRFLLCGLAAFIGVLGFVAAFNFFVDPYDALQSWPASLSRERKPLASRHLRLIKAADIIHRQPEAIVLGSSRVLLGFDALSLKKATGLEWYNVGLSGCTFEELFAYFQHALANNPNLKQVIIGLDLFAFNENRPINVEFSSRRLGGRWLSMTDYMDLLCSHATFKDTLKTLDLKGKWSDKDSSGVLDEAGFLQEEILLKRAIAWEPDVVERDRKVLDGFYTSTDVYGSYHLSDEALKQFRSIVDTCRSKGIGLKVFFPPCRAPYWHALYLKDQWKALKTLREAIVRHVDLWDFSGVNAFTDESYDGESPHFIDLSHFRPCVGSQLFALMTQDAAGDCDYFVTLATLDAHERQLEEQQQLWASRHPEWDSWIREKFSVWKH